LSIAATNQVWEQDGISPSVRYVLLAIADMINRTGEAWPLTAHIAAKTRISERTVQRHITQAINAGAVIVVKNPGKRSIYRFPTPDTSVAPTKLSPPTPVSQTPDTSVGTPPLKNRNESFNNAIREEPEKKEWVEVVDQAAQFCGGQPLTEQQTSTIQEKYGQIDLLDQALAFESYHIEAHRKSNYRTFATYARFSTTWLSRALEQSKDGTSETYVRRNIRGKVLRPLVKPGDPSPLL